MTSSPIAIADAQDRHAPRLWQVWRPFMGIHRWYFAKGCPPPLRKLTGLTACVHASILLSMMGFFAAVIGLFAVTVIFQTRYAVHRVEGIIIGMAVGIFVVIPLSRWINRSWSIGLLLSVVCFGLTKYFDRSLILWIYLDHDWHKIIPGLWQSLIYGISGIALSFGMVSRNRRTWCIPALAGIGTLLAIASESAIAWAANHGYVEICRTFPVLNTIVYMQPVLVSLIGLSIAISVRLWPGISIVCPNEISRRTAISQRSCGDSVHISQHP